MTLAVVSLAIGGIGAGGWSLDDAFDLSGTFSGASSLAIAAVVGIGGAASLLAVFWRPTPTA